MTTPQPVLDETITEKISDKLDGIRLPVPEYKNVPGDLESAIQRIMTLEVALEDLARAVEIAIISRQFELVEGFRSRADELLINKIIIEHPSDSEFKLTIIDNGSSKS